jgi:protein-S-isoprenylcysteine O-methyltransferase Ste14
MRNLSNAAKWVLLLLVGLPLFGYVSHGVLASSAGSAAFGIIMCLPIVGLGMLFWKFATWHRGFHHRMTRRPHQ